MVRLFAQGSLFINAARDFITSHDKAIAALSCKCRQFRLGIAEHVAGPEIPVLLAKLNERDPALTIEVRLENSTQLLEAFDNGELDAIIVRQDDDHRSGEDLGPEHFGWFAAPTFHQQQGKPLKLAALAPCCRARNIAINELDNAKIEWVEVFVATPPP